MLQRQDEFVVIRTIVPGGPAMLSGKIKVGDRVVAVGQGASGPMTDVVGWRIDDVVDLIRGDKGTKVRLDVLPADVGVDGPHKLITIVRDKVKLEEQAASKSVIDVGGKDDRRDHAARFLPRFRSRAPRRSGYALGHLRRRPPARRVEDRSASTAW